MNLRHINTSLLVAIVVVNGYLIVMPFLPRLLFWYDGRGQTTYRHLAAAAASPSPAAPIPNVPNQLVIPSMLYDQPIIEGATIRALHYGPWRLPAGSTPDKGGNTVIAGHRFTYTNPRGTFYSLDKVKVGDQIAVYWQSHKYRYQVTLTEIVPPTDIAVVEQTTQPQLTLFTCTPLWSPKDRLVVIARLESVI